MSDGELESSRVFLKVTRVEGSAGREYRAFSMKLLPPPSSVQVQLPPLSAREAALSLSGAAEWIFFKNTGALGSLLPASSVEWLPGVPAEKHQELAAWQPPC